MSIINLICICFALLGILNFLIFYETYKQKKRIESIEKQEIFNVSGYWLRCQITEINKKLKELEGDKKDD